MTTRTKSLTGGRICVKGCGSSETMSVGHAARQRSLSSHSGARQPSQSSSYDPTVTHPFEPCASTASLLLYAQGSSILCLHHDTLALDRRFEKHISEIQFISVDNVSERGAGRFVVSYDSTSTAIVWDVLTGQEWSRLLSTAQLTVAAWMRNGNIALGNVKGEVILFVPQDSQHKATPTIYDPITAMAPTHNCQIFAIGYQNGEIILATLEPTFTKIHSLKTPRAPSPVSGLAWHASSSKQKSDMLASITLDGDLRVWSVAKPPETDAPRIIRVLKKSDQYGPGRNWITWSKNGRIIQFSENATWAWDVRTKHVTYDVVPTVDRPRALAAYGPTATLFTLGYANTVQQYDLERQQMVANQQHLPMSVPPTPPDEFQRQLGLSASESEEEVASPAILRANRHIKQLESARRDRAQGVSPRSTSHTDSMSSATSIQDQQRTSRSRENSIAHTYSAQSQISRDPHMSASLGYASSLQSPVSAVSAKSTRKGSRLKQEVIPSPEDDLVRELFPYTRSRLNDVPYKPARSFDEDKLTPDDLRRQMLSVVFGWNEDIRELIRDELDRHPQGSQSGVLLSKWLDDEPDTMASMMGTKTASSLDWMMLALSGISNQAQSKKMGEMFVEKMLAKGDIHAAATILASLGDFNDAIEVYVSRACYLEAILLTCLLMPQNWQRISFLVRDWGTHVVKNSEQHLAIRCFSCTEAEPAGPWTSPTAQKAARFPERNYLASPVDEILPRRDFLNAPTPVAMAAPPTPAAMPLPVGRGPSKNPALKLITSFEPPKGHFRFPGLKTDDQTPTNAPGVTPIAESAIGESAMTPGGLGSYRMNNARSLSNAMSRNPAPVSFSRQRLPSIGETPIDSNPPPLPQIAPKPLPTPDNSGSDKEKEPETGPSESRGGLKITSDLPLLLTSARYDPGHTPVRETPITALPPSTSLRGSARNRPPSPTHGVFGDHLQYESHARNSSRGRRPDDLHLQWPPGQKKRSEEIADRMASMAADVQRTDTAGTFIDSHSEMTSPAPLDDSETTSPPYSGTTFSTMKSPSVSGRSIDQYISSLDEAQYYSRPHRAPRASSRDPNRSKRSRSRRQRAPSEDDMDRGRPIPPAKRSPTSPVSMSPNDLNLYNASVESLDMSMTSRSEADTVASDRTWVKAKKRAASKTTEHRRHRSSSRHHENPRSGPSSRAISRRHSPDTNHEARGRARSKAKHHGPRLGSPVSPQPMSPSESDVPKFSDAEPALRLVSHDRQRLQAQSRSGSRSQSRQRERGVSSRREQSPERRRTPRARSSSRQAHDREHVPTGRGSFSTRDVYANSRRREASTDRRPRADSNRDYRPPELDLVRPFTRTQTPVDLRRKEIAAAELEARRLSLARRPSAPAIPLPGQDLISSHMKSRSVSGIHPLNRSQTVGPESMGQYQDNGGIFSRISPTGSDSTSPVKSTLPNRLGLPATPRAMRRVGDSSSDEPMPELTNKNLVLSNDIYQGSIPELPRSMSAPIPEWMHQPPAPPDVPAHPAFDRRIPTSRSSSKTRDGTFSPPSHRRREPSRERVQVLPEEGIEIIPEGSPPTLPELQHLAIPPPPPPPPGPPMTREDSPITHDGDTVTLGSPELSAPSTGTLEQSQFSDNGSKSHHRRGRSINENLSGRFHAITTRLRSASRGRNTRSPHADDSSTPSPYESIPRRVEFPSIRV